MSKDYHFCEKVNVGSSDISQLLVRTFGEGGTNAHILRFGGDGSYHAYLVTDPEIPIPYQYVLKIDIKPYTENGCRSGWIQFFGDFQSTFGRRFKEVCRVYRCGEYGCIIQCW